jgi:glutathione S-transferase
MKLYVDSRFLSPYALCVFVALREKNLAHELLTVDLEAGASHAGGFARQSLTHRVPTLVDDGFALSESSAISEYLEEAWPAVPIYPQALQHRARARQVQAWLRSDLMPLRAERPTEVIFSARRCPPLSLAARGATQLLIEVAGELLRDGSGHLCGDWCIADTDLALMLQRLIAHGDDVPAPLIRYAQRQWERPAVQAWVALPRTA